MASVYILTSGSYSDYSIRAVFSTREGAQAHIDEWKADPENAYRYDDPCIEEWPLDDEVPPDAHHKRVAVEMSEGGDVLKVTSDKVTNVCGWSWHRLPDPARYPAYRTDVPRIRMVGAVWARDEAHAVKIAGDVRAASIAAGILDKVRSDPRQTYLNEPAAPTPSDPGGVK